MCVLAAQQDNETNMANDYSMSEKTNRGRAREEAADVKPCQVQLDHLKSLAGRADKVQFVQHISAHLSHMCSPLTAFSATFGQIFTLSHITLWGKDVLIFYFGVEFIYDRTKVNSPSPLTPPTDKIFRRKGGEKRHFFLSAFLLSLFFIHPRSVFLLYTHRHTRSCTLWWMAHICHPVSWVFLSVWVGSGVTPQALSSAVGELWKPVTNKQWDSLPASHSQMANLGRIRNILYNQIGKWGRKTYMAP